jgi:RHS repeat-associated protein
MAIQLTGVNRTGSPLLSLSQGAAQDFTWSPYGNCPARSAQAALLPGFNGERQDPLTGVTHLGNGYRAYNPTLMRFTCPDSHSPFGNGGVNPYAYCSGDPINQTDPSGHGPALWTVLAGEISAADAATYALVTAAMVAQRNARKIAIGAGIASLAVSLQVASNKTEESNPQASRALEWVARGLGITVGVSLAVLGAYKGVRKLIRMFSQPARLAKVEPPFSPSPLTAAPRRLLGLGEETKFNTISGKSYLNINFYLEGYTGWGELCDVISTDSDGQFLDIGDYHLFPEQLVSYFSSFAIDLRRNKTPLVLLACHIGGGFMDPEGFANTLSALLNRTIYTFGCGEEIWLDIDVLEQMIDDEYISVSTRDSDGAYIDARINRHDATHTEAIVGIRL